nr:hypothetical protein [Stackebrandtia nassauensis]
MPTEIVVPAGFFFVGRVRRPALVTASRRALKECLPVAYSSNSIVMKGARLLSTAMVRTSCPSTVSVTFKYPRRATPRVPPRSAFAAILYEMSAPLARDWYSLTPSMTWATRSPM